MKSGIVILRKEAGMTSQGAVNCVKRLFGESKAGHTGTLDPLATGVLPVLLGRAVKASEFMLTADKHYTATLRLGLCTDTEDITGKVLSESPDIPGEEQVLAAVAAMRGESLQTPPMYSALKIGGKKLCDLARAGQSVPREPRPITVYDIRATRLSPSEYKLAVHCSKGTYIRTLCADIGRALGCGGVMSALCRTEAAGFPLSAARTLGEIEAMAPTERDALLLPVSRVFADLPRADLPPFFARLARCGVEIYLSKIGFRATPCQKITLYDGGVFFALGEVREYPDGLAIKPIRQFDV